MNSPAKLLLTALTAALLTPLVVAADDAGKKPAAEKDNATAEHEDHKDPIATHLQSLKGSEFEVAFLSFMMQHHEHGAKMAKLVPDKAKSADLKEMAAKMSKEQQQEIEKMTGWLKEWHDKAPTAHPLPAESSAKMEKHLAELAALSGAEFDKQFAAKMSEHHLGAIQMSKLATQKAKHKELKSLAEHIIEAQTKERESLAKFSKE